MLGKIPQICLKPRFSIVFKTQWFPMACLLVMAGGNFMILQRSELEDKRLQIALTSEGKRFERSVCRI